MGFAQFFDGTASMSVRCKYSGIENPAAKTSAGLLEHCALELQSTLDEIRQEFDALTTAAVGAFARDAKQTAKEPHELHTLLERLQVSDRLNQRLQNLQRVLVHCATAIEQHGVPMAADAWLSLLKQARSTYTTAEERSAFDRRFDISIDNGDSDLETQDDNDVVLFDVEENDA